MATEKKVEKEDKKVLVECVRKFAVEYTQEEIKRIEGADRKGRSAKGMTKMIEPGTQVEVSVGFAKTLQKVGAATVVL